MSIERHHQQLLFLDNLKTSCQICGENDVRCLDFHHRNPGEKSFSVVQSIRSMPRLLQEIEKCDILCANCHRKLHSKRRLWA
jgi:predicted HNH restriction endonuclease